jgi:hypothetical protein
MFLYPAYASALLPSSTAGIREIYLQWLTMFPSKRSGGVGTGDYTYVRAKKFQRVLER